MAAIRITRFQEVQPLNVRRARRLSGLSARAVSLKAGLHDQFVSRLERGLIGEVQEDTWDAIARAMAGEGEFENHDVLDVLKVMNGELSFELRPIEGGDGAVSSAADDSAMGGSLRPAPALALVS